MNKTFKIITIIMFVVPMILLKIVVDLYGFVEMSDFKCGQLSNIEKLGEKIFKETKLSFNDTQSCMDCHSDIVGFVDPENVADPINSVVSIGADGISKGTRNAPTAAYAGFNPALHYDITENEYIGGLFWDGRAHGHNPVLNDPLAEQSQFPLLNSKEMNMPDKDSVINVIKTQKKLLKAYIKVFDKESLENVNFAFDNIAKAVAAFERSKSVTKFTSKYDRGELDWKEKKGKKWFKIYCSKCHNMNNNIFTDYGYENIGLPKNPQLLDNPTDYGLGGFLKMDYESTFPVINDENYFLQNGKFKAPTLRNVAVTPPYGHNGYFTTMKDMIDFLNTRDIGPYPSPEIPDNLSNEVGNMGLSDEKIYFIIKFLRTLTDNY